MESRYQSLCRRLEKACGLSQGILTERESPNYANRDEVRAAQYDTFATVRAMRDGWARALEDLAYGVDALAEHFGVTEAGSRGRYVISIDWDTSLTESSQQAFQQWSELNSRGIVTDAELRQWLMGGTLEEAQRALDAAQAGDSALERILRAVKTGEEE